MQILRLPDVRLATGLCTSSVYGRIRAQLLPEPVGLGGSAVGWLASEVAAVNAARAAGHSDDQVRALIFRLKDARAQVARDAEAKAMAGASDPAARSGSSS